MTRRERYSYLQLWFGPAMPIAGYFIGGFGNWMWLAAFFMGPIIDRRGRDTRDPDPEQERALSEDWFFRFNVYAVVPMQFLMLGFGLWAVNRDMAVWEMVGMSLGIGQIGGCMAITTAHELIHQRARFERFLGGLLLSSVCFAPFKIEHLRSHHVRAATAEDATSAALGVSFYRFLPSAIIKTVYDGFLLESERLRRLGHNACSVRNELVWWTLLSVLFGLAAWLFAGSVGLLFFLLQSLSAVCLLQLTNYTQHYGLRRGKLPNGRYQPMSLRHSWNAGAYESCAFLINLPRHSDHHLHPMRRYQILRHHKESPQLPLGPTSMAMIALLPPLWFRMMNHRVEDVMKESAEYEEASPVRPN